MLMLAYDEWIDEGYDDVHLYSSDSKLIYSWTIETKDEYST